VNTAHQAPLVSIVTPSFNQARFLAETLASVYVQDHRPLEHIVIDAASTDGTNELLSRWAADKNDSDYHLKWISEPDRGLGEAVNKGFERADGEYIGWLNSDDVYFDRIAIRSAVAALRADSTIDVVYGDVALISEDSGLWMIWCFPEFRYDRVLRGYLIPQPTVFFTRRVTDAVRIDPALPVAHDAYVWLVAGRGYKFKHLHRVQAADRDHPDRMTYEVADKWAERREEMYSSFGGSGNPGALARNADRITRILMRLKGALHLTKLFGNRQWERSMAFPVWVDSEAQAFRRQVTMRLRTRPVLRRADSAEKVFRAQRP
jgi:glycosyltransferase involved in cell wall biosynthesis